MSYQKEVHHSDRWEIVVISDADPQIIRNVMERAVAHLAETFGFEGDVRFDIAAFDSAGDCISEYVFDPEEVK